MKRKKPFLHIVLISMLAWMFLHVSNVHGQSDTVQVDTIVEKQKVKEKKGSIFSGRPGKSMLFSLVIPGAGQIYNKSYLRVPFVWGAVGGMGYVLREQSRRYTVLRDSYKAHVDNVPYTPPSYYFKWRERKQFLDITTLNEDATKIYRDQANVNRQWAIVGFTLVWLANGVDAFVDAHLKDFDIDEDLSIEIGPAMDDDPYAPMRMGLFVKF